MKRYTVLFLFLFTSCLHAQLTMDVKDYYLKQRTKKFKNADFEIRRSTDSIYVTIPPVRDYRKNWLLIDYYTIHLKGANHLIPTNAYVNSEYVNENSERFSKNDLQDRTQIGNWASVAMYKRFVSNKDYKCFLKYVQDSTALQSAGFVLDSGKYYEHLNWRKLKEVDEYEKKFNYEYWVINYDAAAKKGRMNANPDSLATTSFIKRIEVEIYPDTSCWDSVLNDSLSDFFAKHYFQDEYFNDYPVFGLSSDQIYAYLNWLTRQVRIYCDRKSKLCAYDYRVGDYKNLMMIPNEYTLGNSVKIELDNQFYKSYRNDFFLRLKPSKIEVNFPSKPFRIVQTSKRMRRR